METKLSESTTEPPALQVEIAIRQAMRSPCAKSRRGVVIYHATIGHLASGRNRPPEPFVCAGDAACRAACNQICIHAEADALNELFASQWTTLDGDAIHVKVVDDKLVPSGGPSCVACSKAMLHSGRIEGVWLYHADGWKRYPILEFHELSLKANGLPVTKKENER